MQKWWKSETSCGRMKSSAAHVSTPEMVEVEQGRNIKKFA